jgi:hypothetical protein
VPRKPRLVGGVKGHNLNDISYPGSPALWAGVSLNVSKSILNLPQQLNASALAAQQSALPSPRCVRLNAPAILWMIHHPLHLGRISMLSPVYFTTMSHSHNPHGLCLLINLVKDAMVSNSNTPVIL